MESLSGTAVSSTVAIVGSIWPKGPAQAGPAIQAQWYWPYWVVVLILRGIVCKTFRNISENF